MCNKTWAYVWKLQMLNDKIILKKQQAFRSDHHNVHTVEINKIAVSSNDDKRLQTSDKITTYPCGTNAFKVCKSEMMMVRGNCVKNYTYWPILSKNIR